MPHTPTTRPFKQALAALPQAPATLIQTRAEPPRQAYRCTYLQQPPPGAGGWLLSPLLDDPARREDRFDDYEQKSADLLFADVTVQRAVSPDAARREAYRHNTLFSMVYNPLGWHMFIRCGEPELDTLIAEGRSAGSLEMYLSRGPIGSAYSQWIINLPAGDCQIIEWNSPHRHFRPLKPYLKTETIPLDQTLGVHVFLPWEALYDCLPWETGGITEGWPFGLIRWTPAGGITWGGKVHEIGRWGRILWQPPDAAQDRAIRINLIRRAWAIYQRTRDALATHWSDPMVGDPHFFATRLSPWCDRLTAAGQDISRLDARDDALVNDLWPHLPHWMELTYEAQALRSADLTDALMRSPRPIAGTEEPELGHGGFIAES